MKKSVLKKYAMLIAKVGANVQKGQYVELTVDVNQEELANFIVEACYKLGAKHVKVRWTSDKVEKTTYKKASLKALCEFPNYEIERQKYLNDKLPCMIYIESSDPDALNGVNQAKYTAVRRSNMKIIKPFRNIRENKYQWVIAGAASPAWAKKVFPGVPTKKAVNMLWEAILKTSRCAEGQDGIEEWNKHNADLKKRYQYLNSLKLDYLHYESKNGTNFKVWLNPLCNWQGGGEYGQESRIYFNPNIPSEEVFTSPLAGKAEGVVYSTKPLSFQGQLIENFSITFKDGKVVKVKAEKGQESLEEMVNLDEGAKRLGEVALVPFESPINETGLLFCNTLYDENAVCHLALGHGFTNLIKGYEKYTQEELFKMGVNDSNLHVDFMIGSRDLSITGYTKEGKKVQIFKNGTWAF